MPFCLFVCVCILCCGFDAYKGLFACTWDNFLFRPEGNHSMIIYLGRLPIVANRNQAKQNFEDLWVFTTCYIFRLCMGFN
jgi:hypothetical protein